MLNEQYKNKLTLLLEETLKELAKPEGNIKDPYGQYFNGEKRKDVPNEINTKPEDSLVSAFDSYFHNNDKSNLEKQLPLLQTLLNKGKYTKVLKAPRGTTVYRLMFNIDPTVAASILRLPLKDITSDAKQAWYVSGGGVLPIKTTKIQGWTEEPNPRLINNISNFSGTLKPKGVILLVVSNTNNGNFFLNPKETPKAGIGALPEEKEIISYGPVKFDEAAYFYYEKGKSPDVYVEMLAKSLVVALNTKHAKKFGYEKQVTDTFGSIAAKEERMSKFKTTVGPTFVDEVQQMFQLLDPNNAEKKWFVTPAIWQEDNINFKKIKSSINSSNIDQWSQFKATIAFKNVQGLSVIFEAKPSESLFRIYLQKGDYFSPKFKQKQLQAKSLLEPNIIKQINAFIKSK